MGRPTKYIKSKQPAKVQRLEPKLQSLLMFIYGWIEKFGRVPTNHEIVSQFGWHRNVAHKNICYLEAAGWITRGHASNAYWPVGVNRTITFEFPATQLIGKKDPAEIGYSASKEGGKEPIGSMERLKEIAEFAGPMLGMHDNDVAAIAGAIAWVEEIKKALAPMLDETPKIKGTFWRVNAKWIHHLKEIVEKSMRTGTIELLANNPIPETPVNNGEESGPSNSGDESPVQVQEHQLW